MMFDAPGSMENVALNITFYSLLSFPVSVVFSIILEWVLFKANKLKGSLILSFLPFLNMILFIVGLFFWG